MPRRRNLPEHLIGGLITKGTLPENPYQARLRGEMDVATSIVQIREPADVLARDRLRKFPNADEASAMVGSLCPRAVILHAPGNILLSRPHGQSDTGLRNHPWSSLVMLAFRIVGGIPVVTARKALELPNRV